MAFYDPYASGFPATGDLTELSAMVETWLNADLDAITYGGHIQDHVHEELPFFFDSTHSSSSLPVSVDPLPSVSFDFLLADLPPAYPPFSIDPQPSLIDPQPFFVDPHSSNKNTSDSSSATRAQPDDAADDAKSTGASVYCWGGKRLPAMGADEVWSYLRDVLHVLKAPRDVRDKVRCLWPGCGKYQTRVNMRKHVRGVHQNIRRYCPNEGCNFSCREDNFTSRHKKCRHAH